MRGSMLGALASAVVLLPPTAAAQDGSAIAARVGRAPDGEVRLTYAARPGACGDGRGVVGFGKSLFGDDFQSFGSWSDRRCVPGPVVVTLTKRGGQVVGMRTRIGGGSSGAVTDLGTVPAREAAAYFLAIGPRLDGAGVAKGRSLLPAVLADSAVIVPSLLAIARDEGRAMDTRRQAVHWIGSLGDASVVPALAALARGDDGARKKGGLAGAAAAALSFLPDDAGVPALIELTRDGSVEQRRQSVFWLGQTDDARARAAVRRVAEDATQDRQVRKHAVFSLGNGDAAGREDFAWLRAFWERAGDDDVKESIAQAVARDESAESGRWLLDRVRDTRETPRVRKQALFWAGQREATSIRDLAAIARGAEGASIREHAIFVLSQRDDAAALDALMEIARDDRDPAARKKALFWIGQRDDERAVKFLRDLITR